jgi:hypothetical protein
MSWCSRCGIDLPELAPDLPCLQCWPATADDPLIDLLVERAGDAVGPVALELLGQIDDRAAAERLRIATGHRDSRVAAAALSSLAWSGDRTDVSRAIRALRGDCALLRSAAAAALAELGTRDAADALADRLADAGQEECEEIVGALAWLRDDRALPAARRLAPAALARISRQRRHAVWSLVRLGTADDRRALRRSLLELPDHPIQRGLARGRLEAALAEEHPAELDERVEHLAVNVREPLGPRDVPRLELTELLQEPTGEDPLAAKFGGQPVWIGEPMWPHTGAGRPLTFYGQLPLLGAARRVAYVFIGADKSWKPLGEGNAVVVQPGPPAPHLASRPMATGPQLYERAPQPRRFRPVERKHQPYQRFVRLTPGADPQRWAWPTCSPDTRWRDAHGDWNKIGGTGLWLQDEPELPGEGWRFAFQFTAGWAGRELGDGAECYGFVRSDGTAALAWDSH